MSLYQEQDVNVVDVPLAPLQELGLVDNGVDADVAKVQWWQLTDDRVGLSLKVEGNDLPLNTGYILESGSKLRGDIPVVAAQLQTIQNRYPTELDESQGYERIIASYNGQRFIYEKRNRIWRMIEMGGELKESNPEASVDFEMKQEVENILM